MHSLIRSLCALALLSLSAVARAQQSPPLKPAPKLGNVIIDRFTELDWRPEDNFFRSPRAVRITLVDAITGEQTVLLADDAEGSPTGDIVVRGNLRLEGPEGTLSGRGLTFRAQNKTGEVLNAFGRRENLLVRAGKIELLPERALRASSASFTTCERDRPDYRLTARELRISDNGQVNAKHITFWVGRQRILSLPSFKKSFRRTVESPLPLPGYNKEAGLAWRLQNEALGTNAATLDYNILFMLRRTPIGTISFEQDLGATAKDAAPPRTRLKAAADPLRTSLETSPALLPSVGAADAAERRYTLYALLSSSSYVYNRKRTDIRVSQLPEVGVSLWNILNRPRLESSEGASDPRTESLFGRGFFQTDNWLLNAEAGVGYLQERPSHTETTRLGARADATSPLFPLLKPLYARFGGTLWGNLYGSGGSYAILAPEFELDFLYRRNTLFGAAYRYLQDYGKTPFLFDRRDVRHELRLRYGFLGAHWAYDLNVKYDMDRKRAYDTGVSIRRRFDCMEVGLGYQTRSQSFGIILNLLPGAFLKASQKLEQTPLHSTTGP